MVCVNRQRSLFLEQKTIQPAIGDAVQTPTPSSVSYHEMHRSAASRWHALKVIRRRLRVTRKAAEGVAHQGRVARPRQISLGVMLVVMLIFTLMSVGLFYASRVEAIQTEIMMFFGVSPLAGGKTSRQAHLIFLLFTYASPLLVAAVLSTAYGLMNRTRSGAKS
jgi:hypothetical protein